MNSVILIGRITRDIELRYMNNQEQTAIVKFNLAVNRIKKDEADFPRVTVFGRQAENLEKYCHKGSQIAVQGRLTTGSYTDKEGKTVFTTEVTADRIEYLDKKEESPADDFKELNEDVPF